jgi:hypothetical protein
MPAAAAAVALQWLMPAIEFSYWLLDSDTTILNGAD